MKNHSSCWCNWWHTTYRKTRTENPTEDRRTQDTKEHQIIEDPREDPSTEDPEEDPFTEDPREDPITEDLKEIPINKDLKKNPITKDTKDIPITKDPYYYYQFILCWQDVKILQLKYLHNRSYTKNSMLIKVNKLKLIWSKVKERKSYNNVVKQVSS